MVLCMSQNKEIFGSEKEIDELVSSVKTVLREGAKALPVEQARKMKGYGVFTEIIEGKLTFGARIRTVGGRVTPDQLREIGQLSRRYGRNYVDITNRQGFQIHFIGVDDLGEVLREILEIGLTTKGGCGDTPRAITTCPVSDVDKEQLFDVTPLVEKVNRHYYEKWDVFGPSAIPRKFKVSITACPYLCSYPQINCVGLIGVTNDGREGFTVTIGGGLSSAPHIGKHMPVFIEEEDVIPFLEAVVEIWKSNPKYRPRHRARIKFMVDDYGTEKLRRLIEARLERKLEDYQHFPESRGFNNHMGVHGQRNGDYYIGVPVAAGKATGEKLISLAELVEKYTDGGDVRVSPQQNLVITNVPGENLERMEKKLVETGFPYNSKWAGNIVSDIASPFCSSSRVKTKHLAEKIINYLDQVIRGNEINVRIHLTGCPRDCGQHWIADIGLQGKLSSGRELYEVTIGGGSSRIGRIIGKDVPAEKVQYYIGNILKAYLKLRSYPDETFLEFCDKYSINQLAEFMETGFRVV